MKDPVSNRIQVNYSSGQDQDTGRVLFGSDFTYVNLPHQVTYGSGYTRIDFTYSERPDERLDARSGRLRKLHRRLEALQVYVGGATAAVPDARYEVVYLDEETEACPGEVLPSPTEVDLEAASVVHRILRTAAAAPAPRTIRCVETDSSPTVLASEPEALLPYMSTGYESLAFSATNFDGDPYAELLAYGRSGCDESWSTDDDVQGCNAGAFAWSRNAAGEFAEDTALEAAISEHYNNDFVNCDGRTFLVDANRDGATDLIFAPGSSCDPGVTSPVNAQGILYGVPRSGLGTYVPPDPASFPYSADGVAEANFVDIDGDGYVDLLLPDPATGTWTE